MHVGCISRRIHSGIDSKMFPEAGWLILAKDVPVAVHSLVLLVDILEGLAYYRDMLPVCYVLWQLARTKDTVTTVNSVAVFAQVDVTEPGPLPSVRPCKILKIFMCKIS